MVVLLLMGFTGPFSSLECRSQLIGMLTVAARTSGNGSIDFDDSAARSY